MTFLHGDLKEEIYMIQPSGFKKFNYGKVYKLKSPYIDLNNLQHNGTRGLPGSRLIMGTDEANMTIVSTSRSPIIVLSYNYHSMSMIYL